MKLKSNQTRTYDGDGYKKRAACLCFRSESEEEVRRPAGGRRRPTGFPGEKGGWGAEWRGPAAAGCHPAAGRRGLAAVRPGQWLGSSALGTRAWGAGRPLWRSGGPLPPSLPPSPQGCCWPRGGGCGRALAATSRGQPFDSNVELLSPYGWSLKRKGTGHGCRRGCYSY